MERIRTFITLLAFITWLILSLAAEFTAQVVGVIDGDHAQRIRLNGIDCAEKGQAYGTKAKQATSDVVFGKEVTLHTWQG